MVIILIGKIHKCKSFAGGLQSTVMRMPNQKYILVNNDAPHMMGITIHLHVPDMWNARQSECSTRCNILLIVMLPMGHIAYKLSQNCNSQTMSKSKTRVQALCNVYYHQLVSWKGTMDTRLFTRSYLHKNIISPRVHSLSTVHVLVKLMQSVTPYCYPKKTFKSIRWNYLTRFC